MSQAWVIISAQEADRLNGIEESIVEECRARNIDCYLIPPLYHVVEGSPLWKSLPDRVEQAVLFCRLHPRPAEWLLRRHGIVSAGMRIFNLDSFPDAASAVAAALAALQEVRGAAIQSGDACAPSLGRLERFTEPCQSRWYPVMDGSRCVACQHCLQFCLFGVYALDAEGKVTVCNPDCCKPGCPACSRICPQSALMFPLYAQDAAIAGAPGQFVAIDAAARKMFYTRTGKPCPVCGATPVSISLAAATAHSNLCPECGRPQPVSAPADKAALPPLPFDDLDALVDRLDQQMQRRS